VEREPQDADTNGKRHVEVLLWREFRGNLAWLRENASLTLRVSKDKQGRSGLGIEAQRAAVSNYLNGEHWTLVSEYIEVESGKRSDRPKLAEALAHAKVLGGKLVIAKLDRLTRNVDLLRSLVSSDVDLVFCDLPSVPPGPNGTLPAHPDGCRC